MISDEFSREIKRKRSCTFVFYLNILKTFQHNLKKKKKTLQTQATLVRSCNLVTSHQWGEDELTYTHTRAMHTCSMKNESFSQAYITVSMVAEGTAGCPSSAFSLALSPRPRELDWWFAMSDRPSRQCGCGVILNRIPFHGQCNNRSLLRGGLRGQHFPNARHGTSEKHLPTEYVPTAHPHQHKKWAVQTTSTTTSSSALNFYVNLTCKYKDIQKNHIAYKWLYLQIYWYIFTPAHM